jgi:hypothetical protein
MQALPGEHYNTSAAFLYRCGSLREAARLRTLRSYSTAASNASTAKAKRCRSSRTSVSPGR